MKNQNDFCRQLSLRQTAQFLKKHDNYIILTHASPDGDTLGSAFALYYGLKEMRKTAAVICPDVIPSKYSYFAHETDYVSDNGNATVIAVDVADKRLLGGLAEIFGDRVDLNIDHHISNTRYARSLYLDDNAAATAECIFELLTAMRININDTAAQALYTGLSTDTGCFKYGNVTSKTHMIAAQLYEYKLDASEINKIMFDTKSRRLLELERMVLDTAEYHFNNRCIILTVTAEMQEKTGCSGTELEGIAVISRSIEGVIAGVTIKQTDDAEYKVSLRTYPPLSAADICRQLGGGGHYAAAGATVTGNISDVKKQVLQAVEECMNKACAEGENAGTSVDR